jgi:hypothetical protein
MDSMSRIKDQASERYAALADTPRVMAEARDDLAELHSATLELGRALVDAGLPRPVWRSEQATLHLLSTALPAITLDAFLTRLDRFATRDGPTWLRGAHDDLAAFHEEGSVLVKVALPLREVVYRLQHLPVNMPGAPRSDHPLQRAIRHPRLQGPLDAIAEILGDLEALAPFMRPLTSEQWRALERAARPHPIRDALLAWGGRLRIRSAAIAASSPSSSSSSSSSATPDVGTNARSVLEVCRGWMLQRFAWLQRRTRAHRALLAAGLVIVVVTALVALIFSRQQQAPGRASTLSSSAVLTALAGSDAATASVTVSPAPSVTPVATGAPAPKLALTCLVQGATATLTIKNAGASSLTWQAQPPPTLTVSPAQGSLQAGQSATARVSAVNKKNISGTITVTASHDGVSMEDKVPCH